jgi:hypothetical protein
MDYKFTLSLDADQVDELVVASLKDTYEECVKTLLCPTRQWYDPIEDVIRRQEALSELLQYHMAPLDYKEYVNYWNAYTLQEGTANEEDKDTGVDD